MLCANWLATEQQSLAVDDALWCFGSGALCFVVMSAVEQGFASVAVHSFFGSGAVCFVE